MSAVVFDARSEAKGIAAAGAQTLIAISAFFFAKEALHGLPVGPLVLLRSIGAALLLLPLILLLPKLPEPISRADWRRLTWLGIAGVPMNQGLFLWGLSLTSPAHAGLLYGLTPAVVLLMRARSGRETVTRARVAGIALALAGVVLVLVDSAMHVPAATSSSHQAATRPLAGDLLVLCAVFSWASYTAYSSEVVARIGAVRATAGALSIGAAVYAPIGAFLWWHSGWSPAGVSNTAWFGLLWLIVMSSVAAYLLWYYAIKHLDASRVAVFNNLQPIGTAVTQWAVFGLPLGAAFVAGGALAVAGVVVAQQRAPIRSPETSVS